MMITPFEFLHMRAGSQGRSNEIKNVAFLLMLIAPRLSVCHATPRLNDATIHPLSAAYRKDARSLVTVLNLGKSLDGVHRRSEADTPLLRCASSHPSQSRSVCSMWSFAVVAIRIDELFNLDGSV